MSKTSKDFFIFSIRTVPSKYWLRKYHNREPKANAKLYEVAGVYNDFYNQLVEKVTGKEFSWWFRNYTFTSESKKEQMHEDAGVWTANQGDTEVVIIPNEQVDLIKWVEDNWNNFTPMKRLKRLPSIWLYRACETPSRYFRDKGIPESTKKMFEEIDTPKTTK
jgi:hypothetical protein